MSGTHAGGHWLPEMKELAGGADDVGRYLAMLQSASPGNRSELT